MTVTRFDTVLIANRGEIALRVIRSCRALGLRSVAIHTDLDASAPHVRAADDAVRVSSYLDIGEVVAAAVASGAGAVHPGYGFLSERAPFARALEDAGLALVGPSADVMDAMGRKDAAREIAVKAGVPVVPAYSLDDDPATFAYPVLVKAAAGGGGKGMRVVRSQAEYAAARDAAGREARSSFGDDTLLIEKYVESGRHIEVQVLGDAHGSVVHLFERDCSTQRRHQKVLEEAPAPTLTPEQREEITASAVALAREVGYVNAGTVEFLLDNATGEAYFLEMNTRLQVEHPVTEAVVRVHGAPVDLVALQLQVAQGQPLGFDQADVSLRGHAIEARVYAEDSWHGFLPQAGTATYVHWPTSARVDAALESGQEVSTSYDPMLGKVIAAGPDREAARRLLVEALGETVVLGLTTNVGFLRELARHDAFRDATIDTAWLDRTELHEPVDHEQGAQLLAAWSDVVDLRAEAGPWAADGWRDGGAAAAVRLEIPPYSIRPTGAHTARAGEFELSELARAEVAPDVRRIELRLAGEHAAQVGGPRLVGHVHRRGHAVEVVVNGQRFVLTLPDVFGDHGPAQGDGTILAPMPGTVLAVNVTAGQTVEEGDVLGVMEAMKMELALKAPYAGTVAAVDTTAGAQVALGARLFHVEPVGGTGESDA